MHWATLYTLPETNQCAPENKPSQKWKFIFQPLIFRGEMLLVSGRAHVRSVSFPSKKSQHIFTRLQPEVIDFNINVINLQPNRQNKHPQRPRRGPCILYCQLLLPSGSRWSEFVETNSPVVFGSHQFFLGGSIQIRW